MTWITTGGDDQPILEEITKQSDRGAALIASAYLEERLLAAIKARLNSESEIEKNLFGGSQPLGSLSAKIDIGCLLGVYGLKVHKILHQIRKIRNKFAHESTPTDFNTQSIKDICEQLCVKADFQLFNKTTQQSETVHIEPDGTSRTNFLNAIKLCLLVLQFELSQLPLRKPAAPVVQTP